MERPAGWFGFRNTTPAVPRRALIAPVLAIITAADPLISIGIAPDMA